MSLVLAHFAIGAVMTALLIEVFFRDLHYKRTAIVFGGIWGLIPDTVGVIPSYAGVFQQLIGSPWANLFWFHRIMDQLEEGAGSPRVALALTGILVLVVTIIEWRENNRCKN